LLAAFHLLMKELQDEALALIDEYSTDFIKRAYAAIKGAHLREAYARVISLVQDLHEEGQEAIEVSRTKPQARS